MAGSGGWITGQIGFGLKLDIFVLLKYELGLARKTSIFCRYLFFNENLLMLNYD